MLTMHVSKHILVFINNKNVNNQDQIRETLLHAHEIIKY